MHAHLIDVDADSAEVLRDALADVGCLDLHVLAAPSFDSTLPELVVVGAGPSAIEQVMLSAPEVPVLAVCDEGDVDLALAAGAAQCCTRPLRRGEVVGRVRDMLRQRRSAGSRAARERRMSDTIRALVREKQDLEKLVCVDGLTGIANRRHAMELLAAEWRRSAREHLPLGLVMIDLDCYHAYNERYGHLGGDACLQQVVGAMVRCLRRPSDFLGRYGGEEFMAVLPNTDSVGAKIVAERMRATVEALAIPHVASTAAHVVTITAGFAAFKVLADVGDSMDKLIAAADAALLRAKAEGRNRIGGEAPLVRPARVSAQRWQRYTPVFADPWFADRIPKFLASVQHDVSELIARRCTTTSSLVTPLRHAARDLGLSEVGQLLADIEAARELADVRAAADAVLQYVTHVQVIYRRNPEAAA